MAEQELKIRIKGEYSEAGLKELETRLLEMKKQLIDLKSKFGTKSEWVKSEQKAMIDLQNDIKNYKTGLINQAKEKTNEVKRLAKEEANEVKRLAKEKADAEKKAIQEAKEASKFKGQKVDVESINAIKQQILYFSKLRNEVSKNSEEFKKYSDKLTALKTELRGLNVKMPLSGRELMELGENITTVAAGIYALVNSFKQLGEEIFNTAKAGAEFSNLKNAFIEMNGGVEIATAKLELLRKAAAGNLNDKALYEYTNRMIELGYSIDETVQILDFAERNVDRLGGTIDGATGKVLRFMETGKGKGLYNIGVDIERVNLKMQKLSGLTAQQIKDMEGEAQQRLRARAFLELYGSSVDNVNRKQQDTADKLNSVGTAFDNAKLKAGEFISGGIVKLAEFFGLTNEKMAMFITVSGAVMVGITTITGAVMGLTLAMQALNISTGGILTIIGAIVGIAAGAGLMFGAMESGAKSFDELKGAVSSGIDEVISMRNNISELQFVLATATGVIGLSAQGTEEYRTILERLKNEYPAVTDGINVNIEALKELIETQKEDIGIKEKMLELKYADELSNTAAIYEDYKDDIDSISVQMKNWNLLVDQGKVSQSKANEEIAKLKVRLENIGNPLEKMKYNFQLMIAQGLKLGNVTSVMELLNARTSESAVLQEVLKNSVSGLGATFVSEYLGISGAIAKSAELQEKFLSAIELFKSGAYDQAIAKFQEVMAEAKRVQSSMDSYVPKSGRVKTSGTGRDNEIEKTKEDFKELDDIMAKIESKKIYNEWDYNMLNAAMDELIALQMKYNKGSEEHQKIQKEINSLDDEALKMGDEAMKQYEAEKKEKEKIWQAEIKRREEVKKQTAELKKENEKLSIDLTENDIERKKETVRYEYAEKVKNLLKMYELDKGKNSELNKEIEKQKRLLWDKERLELKKIQTELITGIITTFQSDLQGVQNIAGDINRLFNEGSESMLQKFITALEIVRQMKELIESIGDYKDILKGILSFIPGGSIAVGMTGGGGSMMGLPGAGGNGFGLDFIPVRGSETVREVPYVVGSKISGRDIDLLLRRVERIDGGRIG